MTAVGVACVVAQVTYVAVIGPRTESPNAATRIAVHWMETGEYAAPGFPTPYRALVLPGEPAYVAAGLILLPSRLRPFLHLPIVLLFVLAISSVGWIAGGARFALVAGGLAALDPFVVAHGLVWDDAFLAAAMDWTILAAITSSAVGAGVTPARAISAAALVALVAGVAAVTRMQSQIFLVALGLTLMTLRRFRAIRRYGLTMIVGVMIALGVWGARNQRVLGTFFIGSTHDGQTLWHSNHPQARASIVETGVAQSYAPMPATSSQGELAADRFYRQLALQEMAAKPVDALRTAAFKIGVSALGIDFRVSIGSLRNLVAIVFNVLLLSAAIAGAWGSRRMLSTSSGHIMIAGGVIASLVTLAMLAIGPVGLRYRISVAGFLYLWSAAAIQRRWRPRSEVERAR